MPIPQPRTTDMTEPEAREKAEYQLGFCAQAESQSAANTGQNFSFKTPQGSLSSNSPATARATNLQI